MKAHQELLTAAIERDGEGQRALMAADRDAAREAFLAAAELYRQSWEQVTDVLARLRDRLVHLPVARHVGAAS